MPPADLTCDVLVIGSGAGGLSAAVTAASHGLKVIVTEKADVLGGASAWSGGWMWVPLNPLAQRAGIIEDSAAPRAYLRHELGNRYDEARVDTFLSGGPKMVAFFEQNTALQFHDGNTIADIHGDSPGAGTGGRSIIAAPYDGRKLGPLIRLLRLPLRETALYGLPIQAGKDLAAFLNATRSVKSALHVARRLVRHGYDLVRHGRAMQLCNGSALVARLIRSAADKGVTLLPSAPAVRLLKEGEGVGGAVLRTPAGDVTVKAGRAIILAAGGFPHDVERRKALYAHAPTGKEHWSVAVPSASGDGLRLGESVGAEIATDLKAPGAWCPVSLVPHDDGTVCTFPHIIDRGKPGLIGVRADGRRFCNEADGYHDFVAALLAATPKGEAPVSWLICDHRFQRRYGLGYSRPAPMPVKALIRSGYLITAPTIRALAEACGIDAARLEATVSAFNRDARQGQDNEFGRGRTLYNQKQGDPAHSPNPCVAPIEHGPFYAVKVVPGSFGTFAGLKTDAAARVLDGAGCPIGGLYAVGADSASVMGGHYPAGGINLGPAMTFGYLAGCHVAGVEP